MSLRESENKNAVTLLLQEIKTILKSLSRIYVCVKSHTNTLKSLGYLFKNFKVFQEYWLPYTFSQMKGKTNT